MFRVKGDDPMFILKLIFLPFYIILLPFKLIFGSGKNDYENDNKIDDFLDDCEYFDRHR